MLKPTNTWHTLSPGSFYLAVGEFEDGVDVTYVAAIA
jgi:hypothetical protein